MNTLKFLVTITTDGSPPNQREIRAIGANVDMALEIAENNGWILPEGYDGELHRYIVEVEEDA